MIPRKREGKCKRKEKENVRMMNEEEEEEDNDGGGDDNGAW